MFESTIDKMMDGIIEGTLESLATIGRVILGLKTISFIHKRL